MVDVVLNAFAQLTIAIETTAQDFIALRLDYCMPISAMHSFDKELIFQTTFFIIHSLQGQIDYFWRCENGRVLVTNHIGSPVVKVNLHILVNWFAQLSVHIPTPHVQITERGDSRTMP